ncbi:MAG: type IV pili sensor histidine kinase and response regulator [Gallionellaceae bacterium]|nr:MAG: type IV pili sensor histidine kinase and response regulator [Gallionellaceae bacterium]
MNFPPTAISSFAPELRVELPQDVLALPPDAAALPRIKAERGKYQMSLLKWLRQDRPTEALQSMRDTVQAVMGCMPQDRQRAFWWVAGALLDSLRHGGLADDQGARKLLGRIDIQMKSLVEGQPANSDATLREMLYQIACSRPVSDTIAEVARVYALAGQMPQTGALSATETATLLDSMRVQLGATKENWEQCARDGTVMREFSAHVARLDEIAAQIGNEPILYLCRRVRAAAACANDQEQTGRLAPEMAMALLLLDSGLEHYPEPGDEFGEKSQILDRRMQSALAGTAQDERRLADLAALQCRTEARSIRAVLLGEIGVDLRQAEQGLLDLFGDTGNAQKPAPGTAPLQSRTEKLAGLLHRAQNALHFLGKEQPEPLLQALQQTIKYYAENSCQVERGEMRFIQAAFDALRTYTRNLLQQQDPHPGQLDTALRDVQTLRLPAAAQAAAGAPQAAATAPDEEGELLEVFLEEAREVLDNMRTNLEALQREPENREPLVSIRRSFHTLKGSGRMVGLTDLAEAAWAVERTMNKWLQGEANQVVPPGLLKLVLDAKAAFQGWVDSLSARGSTRIETGELVSSARQLENHLGAEPPATGTEPPPVVIGAVTLTPALFGIATEEAVQHIAALLRHLADLRASKQPSIASGFVRAAHTLVGINRTMGFGRVAELADALEQWLEQRIGQPQALTAGQLELLGQTVAALQNMSQAVRHRQEPQAQPELVARLQADQPSVPAIPPAVGLEPPAVGLEPPAPGKPAQQAQPEAAERVTQDDMDGQLLPIFLEETDDLYPKVGSGMRAWREQPDDKSLGRSLQRSLHTLKGSARMAGAMRLGELTHRMEAKVVQAMALPRPEAVFWDELESYFDRIGNIIEQLRSNQSADKAGTVEAVAERPDAARRAEAVAGAERTALAALLRVRSDTVDSLVNDAGEISVTRSRIEAELSEFKIGLLELTDSVSHLRKQLREIEIQAESQMQARVTLSRNSAEQFDPLEFDRFTRFQELTRFMNESVHDVQTVQQSLLKNLDKVAAALSGQAYLNRELQQNLMAIRMVPLASIAERLYRVVRQTGKELHKKANLELLGTEVELDRSMLEKMTAPFEHLLRNAIAHGLENPQQREQAGKSPIGDIRLALRQEGNEVVFELSDDGAGLNFAALREKAEARGLLQPGEAASDDRLAHLIFISGVSTATEVTEVVGRGIGMDVVRSEIAGLGGRVDVSSKKGQGTHFTIRLPLTLAVTQVLILRSGDSVYAIPSAMVELVRQVKPAELAQLYRNRGIEWQNRSYPLHYLPHILGDAERVPESMPHNPVLLLRSGEQRIALHVDALQGKHEAVVKNVGPQLARLPWIAGATVLGNGAVLLVLNPAQLAQRTGTIARKPGKAAPEVLRTQPLVMVVDDSLTVRKITTRLLIRAGYQIITAKDGVDALEQLVDIQPVVMLLDVEMPRMDGFELTKQLRRDARTKNLPIIMITSRTAEKHRSYAIGLGVNAYLGKPYQEKELLQHIATLASAPQTILQ